MKKIFLHIGQTKTATTTLQSFFYENKEWLKSHGILYPDCPPDNGIQRQHRFLVESLRAGAVGGGLDEEHADSAWGFLTQQIDASDSNSVLISEEVFWHLREREPDRRLQTLRWISKRLSAYDVEIICYLRRQDSWIESWYNQLVKADVYKESALHVDDFVQLYEQRGLLDYEAVLGDWADAFGEDAITVRTFERTALLNEDVVADFCALLGVDDFSGATRPEDKQVGLTASACYLSWRFNTRPDAAEFKQAMRRVLALYDESRVDRRRMLPSSEAVRLLETYKDSNRAVAERFGIAQAQLFSDMSVYGPEHDFDKPRMDEMVDFVLSILVDQQRQLRMLRRRVGELESN